MDWWHKMFFPMRRAWFAVASRLRVRKNGRGLLKLHDDVQTCGYEDVQVMWEMLRRSETELSQTAKRKRPFWRFFVWPPNARGGRAVASLDRAHRKIRNRVADKERRKVDLERFVIVVVVVVCSSKLERRGRKVARYNYTRNWLPKDDEHQKINCFITCISFNHTVPNTLLTMDDYGGKRVYEGLGLARNGNGLALRDSQNMNRNPQYCNRLGCSSRITATKDIKISNSDRGKSLKPSFRSSSSKSLPGSSSKSSPGINSVKKVQQNHRKELVIGSSNRARAETEIEVSESSLNHVDIQKEHPNAISTESSELNDIVVDTTTQEVENSISTSDMRSRKQNQSSGSNQDIRVAPMLRRNLSSKSTSQAPSSSSQGQAGSHRYGLRNLSCSSISDVLPSGYSSSDSNRNRRIDLTKKRSSPDAGSSSTRGKSTGGPPSRGNSTLHRTSVAGSSQSYSERSLAQQAIERARNRPLGGNSSLASVRTRRIIGGTTRMQSSEHMFDCSSSQPALISRSSETENVINESTASSSTDPIAQELPSSSHNLCFRQLGLNHDSRMRPVVHPEDNSGWTLRGLSLDRDAFRRFNMDGIAEVLLALERIEQDEELTHEQLLILETNFLLGSLGFHDQHREMRLDIDNMSYEELLALEEQMGTVSTALAEEELSDCLKRSFYQAISLGGGISGNAEDDIKCSICQEEYVEGDEIGILRCEHGYHIDCIHQWLRLKNWCPICKASVSSSS
ncbi:hypothetical protein H6P81_000836 [Aristolochia fimbriata]|uniref:RING-type E3 ubiquitin transferase n=1 Tax=Aristolochia fimbriata TaxID=158543 RepID=A0AAV7F5S7_ARIFI|nr:hypothetical protein H6P81_000836 [Aristolochia fimbriata]